MSKWNDGGGKGYWAEL